MTTALLALLAFNPGFGLELSLPQSTYAFGEPLGLRIELANRGDATVWTIDPTQDPLGHVLQWRLVRAGDSSVAWRTPKHRAPLCCRSASAPTYAKIEAGETLAWTESVLRDASLPNALRSLAPGRYRIELAFRFDPGQYSPPNGRRGFDWSAVATASTGTFTVRPRTPIRLSAWTKFQNLIDSNRPIEEQIAGLKAIRTAEPDLRYRIGVRVASLHEWRGEYDESYRVLAGLRRLPRGGDDLDLRMGLAAYRAEMRAEAKAALSKSSRPQAQRLLQSLGEERRPTHP